MHIEKMSIPWILYVHYWKGIIIYNKKEAEKEQNLESKNEKNNSSHIRDGIRENTKLEIVDPKSVLSVISQDEIPRIAYADTERQAHNQCDDKKKTKASKRHQKVANIIKQLGIEEVASKKDDKNQSTVWYCMNEYKIQGILGYGTYTKVVKVSNILDYFKPYAMRSIIKRKCISERSTIFTKDGPIFITELDKIEDEIELHSRLNNENICKLYKIIDDDEKGILYSILEYLPYECMRWDCKLNAYHVPRKNILFCEKLLCKNSKMFSDSTAITQSGKEGSSFCKRKTTCTVFVYSEIGAKWVFSQVLSGVEYLHNVGIIHKDLKPENIMHTELLPIQFFQCIDIPILNNQDHDKNNAADEFEDIYLNNSKCNNSYNRGLEEKYQDTFIPCDTHDFKNLLLGNNTASIDAYERCNTEFDLLESIPEEESIDTYLWENAEVIYDNPQLNNEKKLKIDDSSSIHHTCASCLLDNILVTSDIFVQSACAEELSNRSPQTTPSQYNMLYKYAKKLAENALATAHTVADVLYINTENSRYMNFNSTIRTDYDSNSIQYNNNNAGDSKNIYFSTLLNNIKENFTFRTKIIDFNTSAVVTPPEYLIWDAEGTRLFTPPECLLPGCDNGINGKARDIWSLGCLLFCLVFGRPPFMGKSNFDILSNSLNNDIIFPDYNPISDEMKRLIRELLAKDPNKRITLDYIKNHRWLTGF